MSRQGNKNQSAQFKGLQYQAKVPGFIAAMQRKATGGRSPSPDEDAAVVVGRRRRSASPLRRGADGRIREALPSRPDEGAWAGGSDDESKARKGKGKAGKDDEEEEDEWEARWGGGRSGEGPQIVVLKEGKHMTEEEVRAARNVDAVKADERDNWKDAAAAASLIAPAKAPVPSNSFTSSAKSQQAQAAALAAKRKSAPVDPADAAKAAKQKRKDAKKEKEKKGLLSFDEE